jgi:hypothetical protein
MKDREMKQDHNADESVQQRLRKAKKTGIAKEFLLFFIRHKSYWIVPIVVFVLLLTALVAIVAVTGGAAAPFIYTLF